MSDEPEIETGYEEVKERVNVDEDREQNIEIVRREIVRRQRKPTSTPVPGKLGSEVFRNGALVRLGRDDDGRPVLVPYTAATLSELLNQWFTFFRATQRGMKPVDTPAETVSKLLAAPDILDVPVVQQIVNAPVFGPSGELCIEPGLLEAARVWYEPNDGMVLHWPVPEEPTDEHLKIALSYLEHLLRDFPFDTPADKANAITLLLLPFVRPMIPGPCPFYDVEAPTAGTGKGLLVRVALFPALGYEIATQQAPESGEEWRKHITSTLLSGVPVMLLDNVSDRLDSGPLASMLTTDRWTDRILGVSKNATVPVRIITVITANNPRFSQEIARRAVQVRLDRQVARPGQYTDFAEPDLMRWARQNRGQLVWSALTIVRAWLARGRSQPPASVPPKGSYEAWREIMGGILTVIGYGDHFLGNEERLLAEHVDDEDDNVCTAIDMWWSTFGGREVSNSDLLGATIALETGGTPVSIGTLLVGPDGEGLGKIALGKALGQRLQGLERRIICGRRIERVLDKKTDNKKWYRMRPSRDSQGAENIEDDS